MVFKSTSALILIFALLGCSSDSGDSSNLSSTDLTGVFIDGPVANIGYKTETKQGVTNASGEYDYLPGESVTFFIGDLEFPTVPASGIVTPLELAGASDTSDPMVVNMIRLLQTLDKNADHSDGIEITEEAKAAAAQVDFNLTVAEFEVLPAVINLITNAGQDTAVTELISAVEAIQNFEVALDESYSVNLTEITATSSIEFSACPGVLGGWDYSFTATEMTMVGTDTWNSCVLGSEETMVIPMLNMAADFDIPFNCQSYPVCTSDDFNKVITGVDQDDRSFTSTYSFDRENGVITYVKDVEGTTWTEVITLSKSTSTSISNAVTVSGDFSITETVTQDDREIVYGNSFTLYCGGEANAFDGQGTQIVSEVGEIFTYTDNMEFNVESNTLTVYWNDDGSADTGLYNPSTGAFSLSQGPILDDTTPPNFSFEYIYSLNGTFDSEAKTFTGTYTEITNGTYLPTGDTVECNYAATVEGSL